MGRCIYLKKCAKYGKIQGADMAERATSYGCSISLVGLKMPIIRL